MRKLFPIVSILLLATITTHAQWETVVVDQNAVVSNVFVVDNNIYAPADMDDEFGSEKLFVSQDNGETYTDISGNLPDSLSNIYSVIGHDGTIFIGSSDGVYATTDMGTTWMAKNNGIPEDAFSIYSLEAADGKLYAGSFGYLFSSDDNGDSWTDMNFFLNFSNITYIKKTDSLFYIKLENQVNDREHFIYSSSDGGMNWDHSVSQSSIEAITVDNSGRGVFFGRERFGSTESGLVVSVDYGANYSEVSAFNGYWVTAIHGAHGTVFVGCLSLDMVGIVYENSSTNDQWIEASEGLHDTNINAIANNDQYLFVAHGDSIISRRQLSEFGITTDVNEKDEVPTNFKLAQNYPNPFNPSTTISYSVPKQSNVSLKVYDVLGKEVAELINTEKSAGSYEVNFDASNLSSGIYFYTLKTNNSMLTRKMMLIK